MKFIPFPIQGRALSRAKSRRNLDFQDVLDKLADMGIAIRVASPKLVMEEAPESYKNVTDVVNTCHDAGISKKAIKLRPIAVIKGQNPDHSHQTPLTLTEVDVD